MELIINETASVCIAIRQDHLTFMSLVILPDSLKCRAISPAHLTIAVPLACFEITLVFGLFKLSALAWQAIVILHDSEAISTAIFECATELVSVFVVHLR